MREMQNSLKDARENDENDNGVIDSDELLVNSASLEPFSK